nr:nuclear transport factor 2 family protein [Candidatus Njordarchaeum guaymaensis]
MKKKEIADLLARWLPAWTGNAPEKLIKFYSEDAFYLDPANKPGLKGHDQILPYFKKLLAANPNWKWEPLELFPTDAGFVAKWKATIPVGSEVITENGMDIVEVIGGKVTRNEVYFDRSSWLEALRKQRLAK